MRDVVSRWRSLLWLTLLWVALWGDPAPGTALAGLLAAVGVLLLGRVPKLETRGTVRPVGLLLFLGRFAVDLVVSSLQVVKAVLLPTDRLRPALVAVPLVGPSDALVALVADTVSLTPGTLTVTAADDRSTLYVHVLDSEDPDADRRDVQALEERALRAFGLDDDRGADDREADEGSHR